MSVYFWSYKDELLYVGSSMDMKQRLEKYRSDDKLSKSTSFIKQLREKGLTLRDLEFEEVKTDINNKNELEILEGKCQLFYKPKFNKNIAGGVALSKTEKNRNADHRREWKRKWWELNKERISAERKIKNSLRISNPQ